MTHDQDWFRFLLTVFYSYFKSKVVNILSKDTTLRIKLNIDGIPISSVYLSVCICLQCIYQYVIYVHVFIVFTSMYIYILTHTHTHTHTPISPQFTCICISVFVFTPHIQDCSDMYHDVFTSILVYRCKKQTSNVFL